MQSAQYNPIGTKERQEVLVVYTIVIYHVDEADAQSIILHIE